MNHLNEKNILITGATGFVGQHLLKALTNYNVNISCLVRKSSNRNSLPPTVKVFEADLLTGQGLNEALAGQDIIIHMAAILFGLSWQDYFVNVQAAEHLATSIKENQRILFVSSLSASRPCAIGNGVEDDVKSSPVSAYGWSKYMSELAFARHCNKNLIILRPPIIYGSGDKGLLAYFKAAKLGLVISPGYKRDFPISLIHASDMAQAIIYSLKPEANGVYHCNDRQIHTMASLGKSIAKVMGKKAITLKMPTSILYTTAHISTAFAKLTSKFSKRPPAWNIDKYYEAKAEGWLCHGQRIQQELGYKAQITLDEGLKEALEGYKKSNLL